MSAVTASASTATEAAIPSATARAMWPRPVDSWRPVSTPRASGAQYGAPRPASAGTNTTPPESGTVPATASSPAGSSRTPTDDSQRSAEPAV